MAQAEFTIVYTGEFGDWWDCLSEDEQDSVDRVVRLLMQFGPALRFPYSSGVTTSAFAHMRELRIQHAGLPYRVLYAFDPKRQAVLLLGGEKAGDDRWCARLVPLADKIYAQYLKDTEDRKDDG